MLELLVAAGTLVFGGLAVWLAFVLGKVTERATNARVSQEKVDEALGAGAAAVGAPGSAGVWDDDGHRRE